MILVIFPFCEKYFRELTLMFCKKSKTILQTQKPENNHSSKLKEPKEESLNTSQK